MHVPAVSSLDFSWFLQLAFTLFFLFLGLLHLLRTFAFRFFEVDAAFDSDAAARFSSPRSPRMPGIPTAAPNACASCGGDAGTRRCSGCKSVYYCSTKCQKAHWASGHKTKCLQYQSADKEVTKDSATINHGKKRSFGDGSTIALVPGRGSLKTYKLPRKILFPYDEFVKLFNWRKPGFRPCGLLNCGNSCFANVVLQCLTFTPPLVAYLLERGHRKECRRNDWCFLCEFQTHVERASRSPHPFSPLNILSRLPKIGSSFENGKQEDAHEFMRFAIDTMQSVCLDEFGGEKAVHPSVQETSLIQHTFGGQLQSQVICSECNKVSNQYENMMDLTVEIHGDATSLEECLDQFTAREWLHGDNMYRCDGCNDYVKASKCLTVRRSPNVLTIALKRFQSGRFGKLNKRVSFPETLDLAPYMSAPGDGTDIYNLYAVVVHVDMLNASFFGHYICYIKDFEGTWYRIDDDKVRVVELEEVHSQGAYMLLYRRVHARPSCLSTIEPSKKVHEQIEEVPQEEPCLKKLLEKPDSNGFSPNLASSDTNICLNPSMAEEVNSEATVGLADSIDELNQDSTSLVEKDNEVCIDKICDAEEIMSDAPDAHKFVSCVVSPNKMPFEEASLDKKLFEEASSNTMPFEEVASSHSIGNEMKSAKESLLSSSTERSVPIEICDAENDERSQNVSLDALSPSKEVSVRMDSLRLKSSPISAEKLEKVDSCGKLSISCVVHNDPRRNVIGGNSPSGAKLKPLFPSGFLIKHSQHKVVKTDGTTPTNNGNSVSASKLKNHKEHAKPSVDHQISGERNRSAEILLNCNSLCSTVIADEPQNYLKKDEMADANFSESRIFCNGDASSSNLQKKCDATNGHCRDFMIQDPCVHNQISGEVKSLDGLFSDCCNGDAHVSNLHKKYDASHGYCGNSLIEKLGDHHQLSGEAMDETEVSLDHNSLSSVTAEQDEMINGDFAISCIPCCGDSNSSTSLKKIDPSNRHCEDYLVQKTCNGDPGTLGKYCSGPNGHCGVNLVQKASLDHQKSDERNGVAEGSQHCYRLFPASIAGECQNRVNKDEMAIEHVKKSENLCQGDADSSISLEVCDASDGNCLIHKPSVDHQMTGGRKGLSQVLSKTNALAFRTSAADLHQECLNKDEMFEIAFAESANPCNGGCHCSSSQEKCDAPYGHCEDFRDAQHSAAEAVAKQSLTDYAGEDGTKL